MRHVTNRCFLLPWESPFQQGDKGRTQQQQQHSSTPERKNLCLCGVTGVAPTMATDLAPPDSHERAGVAVRAAPGEDIAIGSLDDGEGVAGALVCHGVCVGGWVCALYMYSVFVECLRRVLAEYVRRRDNVGSERRE